MKKFRPETLFTYFLFSILFYVVNAQARPSGSSGLLSFQFDRFQADRVPFNYDYRHISSKLHVYKCIAGSPVPNELPNRLQNCGDILEVKALDINPFINLPIDSERLEAGLYLIRLDLMWDVVQIHPGRTSIVRTNFIYSERDTEHEYISIYPIVMDQARKRELLKFFWLILRKEPDLVREAITWVGNTGKIRLPRIDNIAALEAEVIRFDDLGKMYFRVERT